MSNKPNSNILMKIDSWYVRKLSNGDFEVKYFNNLKERQNYLIENDELTSKYHHSYGQNKDNYRRIDDVLFKDK